MEIIDPRDEFAPLDGDKLDFLIGLCAHLDELSAYEFLSSDDQECLRMAQHHIMVLIAQCMAGYELFKSRSDLAMALYRDLCSFLIDHDLDDTPQSMIDYVAAIEEGEELSLD
jgi:hypothetical protein